MTVTDPQGTEWTATAHGSTYLLTRPGAMKWVSASELESQPVERKWTDGLEYNAEQRCWERTA